MEGGTYRNRHYSFLYSYTKYAYWTVHKLKIAQNVFMAKLTDATTHFIISVVEILGLFSVSNSVLHSLIFQDLVHISVLKNKTANSFYATQLYFLRNLQ